MSEFSLIKDYFQQPNSDKSIIVGSGDDAAVTEIPEGYQLVSTIDTLVLNAHFTSETNVIDLGYKAITSSISDLAAMGAKPTTILGSLILPENNKNWLADFSQGLFEAINEYQLHLIGGDIARGPLTITIQANGVVPNNQAILRSGAKVGDLIYVTNTLGAASYGLQLSGHNQAWLRPAAQIAAGFAMRNFAHSCIDISDGFLQDLQHVLAASQVGAKIFTAHIPFANEIKLLPQEQQLKFALSGGEDYQLIMTIPKKNKIEFEIAMPVPVTCVGEIVADQELVVYGLQQQILEIKHQGFQHF
jgi:thiamine-monophosphate kinase